VLTFPKGFQWGVATAAHQVEGGNVASDFWAAENVEPSFFRERSGDAIDQYHRFDDDVALLSALGYGAYRFSIEWARIEPEEGFFSKAALDHYQSCIDACLRLDVAPVITFQHFTVPLWVAKRGGFTDPLFADRFARYCDRAARALNGFTAACTLNELNLPLVVRDRFVNRPRWSERALARRAATEAALGGNLDHLFLFAPAKAILDHGVQAHIRGRQAIKSHHPNVPVGVTLSIQDEQAEPGAEALRDRRREAFYGACLDAAAGDDFIGVQTYTRIVVRADGEAGPEKGHPITMMGYEDRPQALAQTCRYAWARTKTPILVTENGWAGDDDARRIAFIAEALTDLHAAMDDGVDVRGYYYWSAFDNFEWFAGYGPKFGLIAVDRQTQRRSIKPSALAYGAIARGNGRPSAVAGEANGVVRSESDGSPVGLG
jgi:beta-glucosidase